MSWYEYKLSPSAEELELYSNLLLKLKDLFDKKYSDTRLKGKDDETAARWAHEEGGMHKEDVFKKLVRLVERIGVSPTQFPEQVLVFMREFVIKDIKKLMHLPLPNAKKKAFEQAQHFEFLGILDLEKDAELFNELTQ